MNTSAEIIAAELGVADWSVQAVLNLLGEGATIPFVSRYRKEATGALNEVQIFAIQQRNEELLELAKRKAYVTATIEQQGKLTDELRQRIAEAADMARVEDIYLPFKPRRRTRAQVARENGLEPLAKFIMAQNCKDVNKAASTFINENVADAEAAIAGACDIIAEWVSEKEGVRAMTRQRFRRTAMVRSSVIKSKQGEAANYRTYFDVREPLSRCSSHRYLAMRRGEAEGFLRVGLEIDDKAMRDQIYDRLLKKDGFPSNKKLVRQAIDDSYQRLLRPSIETEVAAEAKARADEAAIQTFASNLHQLLLAPPVGAKRTMGIDPGFRTGCKVVCLDANGNLLGHDVIYPTPPRANFAGSVRKLTRLVRLYDIEAIAIGNGTASRETERFVRGLEFDHPVEIFVVSEDGASVYSASELAREEFPEEDVTVRGAVSIARRLMDPLAELVKIDPKSIGVGQYQHDVDQSKLRAQLDMTVESCVNSVGVNLNTASAALLSYVSGIGSALAANIVNYRAEHGDFPSRADLQNVPRLGPKAFEQCAGFLRVPSSENILDNTAVHPERYAVVAHIATDSGHSLEELVAHPQLLREIDLERYVTEEMGLPTLHDIIAELEKPGRDPRERAEEFHFDESVTSIDDLHEGMVLPAIVNNITDFGAFVDLGIHQSGLIHISQLTDGRRPAHPSEVLKLHQQLRVRVLSVDRDRGRIALTLRSPQ